jgi:hypothetical protein
MNKNELNELFKVRMGFTGGALIVRLGSASDMILFFECIDFYVVKKYPNEDFSVIADRLYRKYLKLEELDEAVSKMKLSEEVFKSLPRDAVDWTLSEEGKLVTYLDFHKETLGEIFQEYFDGFYRCASSSKYFYDADERAEKVYQPTMTCPVNIGGFEYYKAIPLSIFDALAPDDKPFWQCPYDEYKHWSARKGGDTFKISLTTCNIMKYKSVFINKVAKHLISMKRHMESKEKKEISLCTEGMEISEDMKNEIKQKIVKKTDGLVKVDDIKFVVK